MCGFDLGERRRTGDEKESEGEGSGSDSEEAEGARINVTTCISSLTLNNRHCLPFLFSGLSFSSCFYSFSSLLPPFAYPYPSLSSSVFLFLLPCHCLVSALFQCPFNAMNMGEFTKTVTRYHFSRDRMRPGRNSGSTLCKSLCFFFWTEHTSWILLPLLLLVAIVGILVWQLAF